VKYDDCVLIVNLRTLLYHAGLLIIGQFGARYDLDYFRPFTNQQQSVLKIGPSCKVIANNRVARLDHLLDGSDPLSALQGVGWERICGFPLYLAPLVLLPRPEQPPAQRKVRWRFCLRVGRSVKARPSILAT
jgi:hypothetical protein